MPMENKIDSMSSFVQYILKESCGENYMSANTRSPDHRYILGNRRWMKMGNSLLSFQDHSSPYTQVRNGH